MGTLWTNGSDIAWGRPWKKRLEFQSYSKMIAILFQNSKDFFCKRKKCHTPSKGCAKFKSVKKWFSEQEKNWFILIGNPNVLPQLFPNYFPILLNSSYDRETEETNLCEETMIWKKRERVSRTDERHAKFNPNLNTEHLYIWKAFHRKWNRLNGQYFF